MSSGADASALNEASGIRGARIPTPFIRKVRHRVGATFPARRTREFGERYLSAGTPRPSR
jgi:hypothetical protein